MPRRPRRPRRPRALLLLAVVSALAVPTLGCGKGGGTPTASKKEDGGVPGVAPLAVPVLGVDQVRKMNFIYGDGAAAYEKAVAAYRAKPRDWAAVRAGCEAALAKDPGHLDAHRLLGTALAQTDAAAAVDHLVTALAGDYAKYGPSVAADEDLKGFLATPHGKAVLDLVAKLKDAFAKETASGLWLVGRRSAFKPPTKPGAQFAASRGELYAYDRATSRYLRLTHTDHQLAGFVRAPSGKEVALLGFDKVEIPPAGGADGKGKVPAPLLARAYVVALDTSTWAPAGARATVTAAREVTVGYGPGDELLVTTAPATGRWTTGAVTTWSVDRATGKLTRTQAAAPLPAVAVTLDEGRATASLTGVDAAWTGDPPTAPTLTVKGGAAIAVPESGAAAQRAVALAPDGGHLAFATAVDPCAKDAAPSLYVADAKTGALKHLLTARSRFATRWLDATTLAYEDDAGSVRLWDVAAGRELTRLGDKGGLALDALSTAAEPPCKAAPPVTTPGDDGGEPEPEPGHEAGRDPGAPVTTP